LLADVSKSVAEDDIACDFGRVTGTSKLMRLHTGWATEQPVQRWR